MNAEGNGNMDGLAKCSMLCGLMPLTKVVDRVAEENLDEDHTRENKDVQISNDDVHRSGRIIGNDCNVATGLITSLGKFAHDCTFHGKIRSRYLYEGRGDCGHD